MTSIDSANQLAALIREQINRQKLNIQGHTATAGSPRQRRVQPGKVRQKPIDQSIAQRVSLIDPQDPDRRRKVLRVFLESILLAELGHELINDPGFYRVVDEVQLAIEHNLTLQPLVQHATDLLLAR